MARRKKKLNAFGKGSKELSDFFSRGMADVDPNDDPRLTRLLDKATSDIDRSFQAAQTQFEPSSPTGIARRRA